MGAKTVLGKLADLGVKVWVVSDKVRMEPGSKVPPALLEEVRANKQDIILHLKVKGYSLRYPERESTTLEEAEEIAEAVEREGVCLVWSTVLGDLVAFYKTEEDQQKIPPGFVPYSVEELGQLFGQGKVSLDHLKLVHEAKKLGCRLDSVTRMTPEGDSAENGTKR